MSAADLRAELAEANHVLVDRGVLDGFGHVSVRADDDTFLLSRNLAPGLVRPEDVQVVGLDGEPLDGRRPYLERFIHAAVYRARPDVRAVVHSHAAGLLPFGVARVPLRPVTHMAGFLAPRVPVFEVRDTLGAESDLLVRDLAAGAELARVLGDAAVVLMRGHGATVVGESLPEAVFRAVYAEVNARVQAEAERLGGCTSLTDAEAAATVATNRPQIERAWRFWRDRVAGAPPCPP